MFKIVKAKPHICVINTNTAFEIFEKECCDLLIIEAAHTTLDKWLTDLKKDYFDKIKDIATMHYGVHYEFFPEVEIALAEKAWGKPLIWTQDRQTIVL